MPGLTLNKLKAERASLVRNRQTRIALWAPKANVDVYQPISADELACMVRDIRDTESGSEATLRRLSKQKTYAGKLFDPLDTTVELTHCVQWKNRLHASYFVRKEGGQRVANR